ncbi:hypothetical protein ACIRU3_37385 [Streptomyces sp. NPDC101151]|uniref:hypothetical protein n=1 Tax=Streptomyces sp. NPDC101151 TaxID=3366115 RepID=UPI00382DEB75
MNERDRARPCSAGDLAGRSVADRAAAGGRDIDGVLVRPAGVSMSSYDSPGRRIRTARKPSTGQQRTWACVWNAGTGS